MTNEEVERSIEFLLQGQASLEAQVERTNAQMARTNEQMEQAFKQIGVLAESQDEFTKIVTRHIEMQSEINASVRDSLRVLTATMEKYFSDGRNGKS
jgi:methyl-accepting chemotaxis protein